MALSPHLNTNVPTRATFELSVSDGLNEATGRLHLQVNLVTETMLANSIQLRMAFDQVRSGESMQTLFSRLQEAFAALFHCHRESIVIFDFQSSSAEPATGFDIGTLNVSLAVRVAPETDGGEQFLMPDLLRERLYLGKQLFTQITGLQVSTGISNELHEKELKNEN